MVVESSEKKKNWAKKLLFLVLFWAIPKTKILKKSKIHQKS
jgi:hypothetical protein